jgi:hypothetical protein
MPPDTWPGAVEARVRESLPDAISSWPDDDMLTLGLGTRAVVLQVTGDTVIFAPSFAAGGAIGSRLSDRVQHLEMTSYSNSAATISAAGDAAVAHLRPA